MVIPAFGYGRKGAKFCLVLKQVLWFSPRPACVSEAAIKCVWEVATCSPDLQLTQGQLCNSEPLQAHPVLLSDFRGILKTVIKKTLTTCSCQERT